METLRRTEDGFLIAEEDFRLRGGGDPLGLKQSGFPAYRFADPIRHRTLMLAAADDARLITNRDPDLVSERGQTRTLSVADFSILPLGARRVRATGTTAAGIHALVIG